jgi:hypothetical protein
MRVSPAQSLRFCGRQFSPAELARLRGWLAEGQCNRSELARRVCAEFGWVNGAGQPKLMSSPLAGAQMRYLIRCQTTVLGGMGFGASAWSVAVRDWFLGWPPEQRQQQLHLIVNHSRFLLLPGAGSPNLASCVLAQVSRQLPNQTVRSVRNVASAMGAAVRNCSCTGERQWSAA